MHMYKIVTKAYYYSLENYQDCQSQKSGKFLKVLEYSLTFVKLLEYQLLARNVSQNRTQDKTK